MKERKLFLYIQSGHFRFGRPVCYGLNGVLAWETAHISRHISKSGKAFIGLILLSVKRYAFLFSWTLFECAMASIFPLEYKISGVSWVVSLKFIQSISRRGRTFLGALTKHLDIIWTSTSNNLLINMLGWLLPALPWRLMTFSCRAKFIKLMYLSNPVFPRKWFYFYAFDSTLVCQ